MPRPGINAKKPVKNISVKLRDLVKAMYMKIAAVDVFPERVVLYLVEPAREVGYKACPGRREIKCKQEYPQHTGYGISVEPVPKAVSVWKFIFQLAGCATNINIPALKMQYHSRHTKINDKPRNVHQRGHKRRGRSSRVQFQPFEQYRYHGTAERTPQHYAHQ